MSYEPQKRYITENVVRVYVPMNKKTDADILAFLETVENRSKYIKELIRADMKLRR